jgi:hypothetical protein
MGSDYLATADVWTVLDLIVAEFTSDPTSTACFDRRIVDRAIALNRLPRATGAQTGALYCASCGESIAAGTSLYVSERGDLLHDVSDGTASCGPVLRSETPVQR